MPTVRHAYLEEYEVAAALTVEAFRQFEQQMARWIHISSATLELM
jgi:hypothetical protein